MVSGCAGDMRRYATNGAYGHGLELELYHLLKKTYNTELLTMQMVLL